MATVLVTGSAGLLGSECVRHFASLGHTTHGIDNNARLAYFGADGDTSVNLARLCRDVPGYVHHTIDIRSWLAVSGIVSAIRPDIVLHCAAQPSHDLAASRPLIDFEVNALGTLHLLEATRLHCPHAVFCFASTNKVYGDAPNELDLVELPTRFDFCPGDRQGVGEGMRVDRSMHSLFGCSKLAADVLVQEYGRYHGLRTASFRCGCLTGGAHAGAIQHGFLAYLVRCCREGRPYTVFGHHGKQVRDQLHAADVARAFALFADGPRPGEVYNLGGGRDNSISVLEAITRAQDVTGKKLVWRCEDAPRRGDHIVYYSDTSKFRSHYPEWRVTRGLGDIFLELAGRQSVGAAR